VEWLSRDSLVLATLPAFRADCPSRCSNTTPATSATPVSLSSLPLLFLSRSEGFKNAFRLLVAEVRRDCVLSDDYNNAPASSYQPVSADSIVVSPLPPSVPPSLLPPDTPIISIQTLPERETNDLCAAFQTTAFAHLDDRLSRAIGFLHDTQSPIRQLVVVGGVAANQALREVLCDIRDRANEELSQGGRGRQAKWEVSLPPPALCTDNGVMVAWTGVELFQAGISNDPEADLQPIPRWPIGTPLAEEAKRLFRKRSKSFLRRRAEKPASLAASLD
jgi:hypothetical protein